jgi:hypothetical protein
VLACPQWTYPIDATTRRPGEAWTRDRIGWTMTVVIRPEPYFLRMRLLMSESPSAVAQSKGAGRCFLRWRHVLLGMVCLSVVFAAALHTWIRTHPPFWWLPHDKAMYARISKAIEDPRHLSGTRLYDLIRKLDLEDIPWDDVNLQDHAGSVRMYHFRGFRLTVNLYAPSEHWQDRGPEWILLEQGSPEEKRQARDWVLIDSGPYALIDGINSREERMRKFFADAYEGLRRFNARRAAEP